MCPLSAANMIKLEKIDGGFTAYWENGVSMGEILPDVDGYYKWWPVFRSGYLDEPFLYAMADTLKELNKKWDKHIDDFFGVRHGEHDMEHGEPL